MLIMTAEPWFLSIKYMQFSVVCFPYVYCFKTAAVARIHIKNKTIRAVHIDNSFTKLLPVKKVDAVLYY